jgi:hypothetical protein
VVRDRSPLSRRSTRKATRKKGNQKQSRCLRSVLFPVSCPLFPFRWNTGTARLAFFRHAASVRPEPGSNSPSENGANTTSITPMCWNVDCLNRPPASSVQSSRGKTKGTEDGDCMHPELGSFRSTARRSKTPNTPALHSQHNQRTKQFQCRNLVSFLVVGEKKSADSGIRSLPHETQINSIHHHSIHSCQRTSFSPFGEASPQAHKIYNRLSEKSRAIPKKNSCPNFAK